MIRRRAVLDANVLIPASPRDTLLRIAENGLFFPLWSEQILTEVSRNLVEHGLTSVVAAQRLITTLRLQFPDALVTGFESRIEQMDIDAGDRHVLAATVHAEASIIVTSNIRHFPESALGRLGIEAQSIDTFLLSLHREAPTAIDDIIADQAFALLRPPLTVSDVLNTLALHAPSFAAAVRRDFDIE